MPIPSWLPDWLPHFAPSGLADWLIFAICIYEAYHTRRERLHRTVGGSMTAGSTTAPTTRLRYWPWITLAIVATFLAWAPVYVLHNPPAAAPESPSRTISLPLPSQNTRVRGDQTKQIADLKAQLRDANSKTNQIETKLTAVSQELETAKAENNKAAAQRSLFCKVGILTEFQNAAVMMGRAGKEVEPLQGETCLTAACEQARRNAQDDFLSKYHKVLLWREQVLKSLSLPNEQGCVEIPLDAPYVIGR
jgi:hypothetical protein